MLVIRVSSWLATMCQNIVVRRGPPRKREPKTTSALPSWIGRQQGRVVARVVLQVGILDQHQVLGGSLDPGLDGGSLAAVAFVQDGA